MKITHKVFFFLILALFLSNCSVVPISPSKTKDSCKKVAPYNVVNKIDNFSKKANVIAVRQIIDGVPTTLELLKLTGNTIIEGFQSPSEYLKGEIVNYESSVIDKQVVATLFSRKDVKIPDGVTALDLQGLYALLKSDTEVLLIDARPKGVYEIDHIPGAVSFPLSELKKRGDELLPQDKDFPLVFYCNGYSCGRSPAAAGFSKKLGYTNVSVLHSGLPAWKAEGYSVHASLPYVESGKAVLIDLREGDIVKRDGRIPGAVSIPFSELDDRDSDLPVNREVPLVLYADKIEIAEEAHKILFDWEYADVAIFPEWKKQWTSKGNALLHDSKIVTEINWKPPYAEYALSLETFQDIVTARDIVVDVRELEEYEKGHFPGAINVPLAEATIRVPEMIKSLPDDSVLYIYCSRGVRARLTVESLLQRPDNTRYLDAIVKFE